MWFLGSGEDHYQKQIEHNEALINDKQQELDEISPHTQNPNLMKLRADLTEQILTLAKENEKLKNEMEKSTGREYRNERGGLFGD